MTKYIPIMTFEPPLTDLHQVLANARAALMAGQLDQAAALCQCCLDRAPDNARAMALAGEVALRQGQGRKAVHLLEQALAMEPGRADEHHALALALVLVGSFEEAFVQQQKAAALVPDNLNYQCILGNILNHLGRTTEAKAVFSRLLSCHPTFPGALQGLATATMPGDDYRSILAYLHDILCPPAYIEIGVENGASLALAKPPTLALAIDPQPRISHKTKAEVRVFATTSDDFFARHDVRAELDGRPLGLAFIDGLHTFEQALRDFINIERYANASTVVVFHDVLPLNEISSARVRRSDFWTGDTWKILPAIRCMRPDLDLFVVSAAPSGLAVVSRLDSTSTVLSNVFDSLVDELMPLTFADWQAGQSVFCGSLVSNRPAAVARRLRRREIGK